MTMEHEDVVKRIKEEYHRVIIDCVKALKDVHINFDDLQNFDSEGHEFASYEEMRAARIIKDTSEKIYRLKMIINYDAHRRINKHDYNNEFIKKLEDGIFDP